LLRDPGQALPQFKEEEVRRCLQEVAEHYESLVSILDAFRDQGVAWEGRPEVASSVLIHHQALLRNKRLLMAYQNMRLERVKVSCPFGYQANRWRRERGTRWGNNHTTCKRGSRPLRDVIRSPTVFARPLFESQAVGDRSHQH